MPGAHCHKLAPRQDRHPPRRFNSHFRNPPLPKHGTRPQGPPDPEDRSKTSRPAKHLMAQRRRAAALKRKTSEIEGRIKRSQAAISDIFRSQAHSRLHHLIGHLGADVEVVRRKKRHLEDCDPIIPPHLGGISDRLQSVAGALINLSAVLGRRAPERPHLHRSPLYQEQDKPQVPTRL